MDTIETAAPVATPAPALPPAAAVRTPLATGASPAPASAAPQPPLRQRLEAIMANSGLMPVARPIMAGDAFADVLTMMRDVASTDVLERLHPRLIEAENIVRAGRRVLALYAAIAEHVRAIAPDVDLARFALQAPQAQSQTPTDLHGRIEGLEWQIARAIELVRETS